jgi:beta-glucanase (GH16 family)
MRKFLCFCVIYVIMTSCGKKITFDSGDSPPPKLPDTTVKDMVYSLVWSDDFSKDGLPDPSKWDYDEGGHGWGNAESQYYTNENLNNAQIENGILYIKAQKENFKTWKYTSARLVTRGQYDWEYGYFEIRAALPYGRGSWPAIWMLPTDSPYGAWPSGGELDIMEHVGFDPGVIVGSAHTEAYNFKIGTQKNDKIRIDTPYDFHVYGIKWDKEEIHWYVDGKEYHSFKNEHKSYKEWPFDQRFHLVLNIAVGGSWGGQQGIDDSVFPMTMAVDYARVYQ